MKFFIVVAILLSPLMSLATAMPALAYKNVQCRLYVNELLVQEQSQKLITLFIDEGLGRFAQIQFGDETKKIQYQLLIEDDVKLNNGAVLILQNLMVGDLESSGEFSGKEVSWVRVAQGNHSVVCDFVP